VLRNYDKTTGVLLDVWAFHGQKRFGQNSLRCIGSR
jgi:hypothetical protein